MVRVRVRVRVRVFRKKNFGKKNFFFFELELEGIKGLKD